jgi:imidazolonepropionase-like amidohydrolase
MRTNSIRFGAGLSLVIALTIAASARAESIALANATVHPVDGPVLENATVVITNGKIAAVGPHVATPTGAKVVDCAGKHIYPGLISANTVLGLTEIESVRGTNDFTEIGTINPNIHAEIGFNPESELIPVARVNGVTSALVMPRGGTIAGTAALMHLDGWTREDMTVKSPLGLLVQWPTLGRRDDFDGPAPPLEVRRKNREQRIEELRRVFEQARSYWVARDAEGKSGVPRHDRDVKWDAMGSALKGQTPVFFLANDVEQIRGVLRFIDDQKLTNTVIVDGADAWRFADELKARNIAVIVGGTLELPQRRYEPYDAAYALPSKLQAAGVRFCIADGGGGMGASNARNLGYHAAMAAAFGLPKDEALKSVTLYPAQILGVSDRLGSITVGKIADLVVANGDPLEITTQVEQVYINGKPVSMETRQTRLFEKYNARPKGPKARKG